MRRYLFITLAALSLCAAHRSTPVHNVKPGDAEKLLAEGDVFLIDVRTSAEFNAAHIPHAILIPFKDLPKRMKELPQDKTQPILIYDTFGSRSLQAGRIAAQRGYKDIYNLSGGIKAWTAEHKPIDKIPSPQTPH